MWTEITISIKVEEIIESNNVAGLFLKDTS